MTIYALQYLASPRTCIRLALLQHLLNSVGRDLLIKERTSFLMNCTGMILQLRYKEWQMVFMLHLTVYDLKPWYLLV